MSESRAHGMYQYYQESGEKYDYFVLGVCIALTGYLGARVQPDPLVGASAVLELIAIACFAGASLAGLLRARHTVGHWYTQFARLEAAETADKLQRAMVKAGGGPIYTGVTPIWPLEVFERTMNLQEDERRARAILERQVGKLKRYYVIRDWLLFVGICALVASKVAAASSAAPVP